MDQLVRSGLFGTLSSPTRSVAPVLLAMSDKNEPMAQEFSIRISYAAIARYSGVSSPNAIRKALRELGEIGFLRFPEAACRRFPENPASLYAVTPNSDELNELAQGFSAQMKTEIDAERELRARLRREKVQAWKIGIRRVGFYHADAAAPTR
jgi:transposase-like protein